MSATYQGINDATAEKNIQAWLDGPYDSETKNTIQQLLRENPQELINAFYTTLSFGTGGLRGIMGVGCNRMNKYTIAAATQGLANYILMQSFDKPSVFISYDPRHHSREFAEEAASVLASNGIQVYLYKKLRPTPLASFGVRYKHCVAGIMITASHNPPAYNGYKVYWNDGGQVVPPHDNGIITEVNKITDPSMVKSGSFPHPLITEVLEEVDRAYLDAISTLQLYPDNNKKNGKNLKIIYSNLHGTGGTMVPQALTRWGFTSFTQVPEQQEPDGTFPTVSSPNPEERSALKLGIDLLLQTKSDILIATDPDADRVGVAVMHHGEARLLTGNEVSCLCLSHICEALMQQNKMPERAAFVKTFVTTELFKAIAESYGKPCYNVLPGFKYIAQLILEWEHQPNGPQYIFGGEESYGYMLGTFTRDKDAVLSCALICEVALHAKENGKTLIDMLHDLYRSYGVYQEKLLSLNYPETKEGRDQMKNAMTNFRKNPPQSFCGVPVQSSEDFLNNAKNKSDMVLFWLADGSKLVVRPSGTEPKIKAYCGVMQYPQNGSIDETIVACDARANQLLQELRYHLLPGER